MAMTASAIRFEPNEKEWIAAFAEMNGSTFWTLERLEDELDARDLSQAIEEDDGTRISWSKVKSDLGLAI